MPACRHYLDDSTKKVKNYLARHQVWQRCSTRVWKLSNIFEDIGCLEEPQEEPIEAYNMTQLVLKEGGQRSTQQNRCTKGQESKVAVKSTLNFPLIFWQQNGGNAFPPQKTHPHEIGNASGAVNTRTKSNQRNRILGWAILSPTLKVILATYLQQM